MPRNGGTPSWLPECPGKELKGRVPAGPDTVAKSLDLSYLLAETFRNMSPWWWGRQVSDCYICFLSEAHL